MRNKLAYAVILTAAAACLSGCSYLVATGPCFGTGCPSRTVGKSGQYKVGEGPKTAANTSSIKRVSITTENPGKVELYPSRLRH